MALSKSCEDKINLQINAELQAGYSYLALVSLPLNIFITLLV